VRVWVRRGDDMKDHKKPRVKFCWECSYKLQGNHHTIKKIDGELRTMHHSCAENYPEPAETDESIRPKGHPPW